MAASMTAFVEPDSASRNDMIIPDSEILSAGSSLYSGYINRPYNPDHIAQKKPPFAIYDEMRRDDQVKSVLWMKKFMTLSSGWQIETESEEHRDIASELKHNLQKLDNPDFGDALTNILTHLDYGFSVTEPVFDLSETGEGLRVCLKKLKTRAPHTFELHTNDFGDLVNIKQDTSKGWISVPPNRVMILIHQYEFGVPYGVSDLQAAYRAWFSKDVVIKFWNIFLERFGNPIAVATIPATTAKPDKDKILDILKNLQAKTGLVVPEGVSIDIKGSPTGATDFEHAVNNHNMMIARSMLIPDLIGISGEKIGGGSYALGEKQFEAFYLTIQKIRTDLERAVNRHIIQPLLLWNWGLSGIGIPKWKLMPIEDKNRLEMMRVWSEAVRGKIWEANDDEINHFRKMVQFPVGEVTRPETTPTQSFPFHRAMRKIMKAEPVLRHESDAPEFEKTTRRKLTVFEKRVDLSSIENTWDRLLISSRKELDPIFGRIREGLIDTVTKKRIIEGKKFDVINSLSLKYLKDLQMAWRMILRETFTRGQTSGKHELRAAKSDIKMQDEELSISEILEESLNERSYFLTGLERDELKKQASIILNRIIEQGLSTREGIHQLGMLFDDFSETRLEDIIRTEMTRTFNHGRKTIFDQAGRDGFVEAYQYSAIMDDRTTEICSELDGHIFRADDPYVDKIIPPRHYNCRSLLIPVISGEAYQVSPHVVSEESLQNFNGTT